MRIYFFADLCKNHRLLKKLRFKSWVFVVFQGRLRRWWLYRDLVQFGHNFEQSCLPPMICPWSACDRPYIYRGPRWKCAKKFVLVKIFRFCKNSEKAPKTNEKCSFLILFCLRKNVFFIEQRRQKCIQKCENFPNFNWFSPSVGKGGIKKKPHTRIGGKRRKRGLRREET